MLNINIHPSIQNRDNTVRNTVQEPAAYTLHSGVLKCDMHIATYVQDPPDLTG